MTHNIPVVDKHEPPAIIEDSQEPTWDVLIKKYKERPVDDTIKLPLVEMMETRRDFGHRKHLTYLTPNNGRDSLTDAIEEILDCIVYLMNAILEEPEELIKKMLEDSLDFATLTLENIYVVWSIKNDKK